MAALMTGMVVLPRRGLSYPLCPPLFGAWQQQGVLVEPQAAFPCVAAVASLLDGFPAYLKR